MYSLSTTELALCLTDEQLMLKIFKKFDEIRLLLNYRISNSLPLLMLNTTVCMSILYHIFHKFETQSKAASQQNHHFMQIVLAIA
jgi:hypothetical protein